MRLRVAPCPYELGQGRFACLKLGTRQSPAKEFVAEPYPVGVENIALAVLGNLADVSIAKATGYEGRLWLQHLLRSPRAFFRNPGLAIKLIFIELKNKYAKR